MTRPLRVVQVITKLDVGGAQETVLLICRSLPRERYDLAVVAGPELGAGGGELRSEIEALGVPVTIEPALRRAIHPVRDLVAVAKLWARWRRDRPDVVHTHSSKAGVIGRIAAWLAGVPVRVHTVHGWSFREHQHRALRWVFVVIERALAKGTTAIVVVAEADRLAGLAYGIGRPEQYHLIRSGIDLEAFRPRAARMERARRRVVTVTRLAPPKDLGTLLRAMAETSSETSLVVVGEGPELEAARGAALDLGLADRVEFAGVRRDVAHVLGQASVFVLSSKSEGLPRAILEAMAAKVPVVATDVGGVPDAIDDGVTGILVPVGDAPAMARAINRLLDDPEEASRIADRGSQAVVGFSAATMTAGLAELYRSLDHESLGQRGRRSRLRRSARLAS
jgi:glycosyltransferase involved in cell wall biosynthesis